jgi:uncharacterized protein (DUF433 family)
MAAFSVSLDLASRTVTAGLRMREHTVDEASAITGIAVSRIYHYVSRGLSGVRMIGLGAGKGPLLSYDGLVALCVADDFRTLTPNARIETIRQTLAHPEKRNILLPDNVSVPVSLSRKRVRDGLFRLRRAGSAITPNRGTLQGEPCFKGTRIPVYVVADIAAASGIEAAQIAYSRLTWPQIELACLYAKAYPRRGRRQRTGGTSCGNKPNSFQGNAKPHGWSGDANG